MNPNPKSIRQKQLARIHIQAKQLGMDRESYESLLWTIARVRSAKDLDLAGRHRVLDHLSNLQKKQRGRKSYPGRPHNIDSLDQGPQLRKVEALLTDAGRPWAYATGMVKRMFKRERIEFCTSAELRKLIAALTYDANRRSGLGREQKS